MFSVVMPVWNARATLRRAVDSALAQTFRDFELIVVDDGSGDGGLAEIGGIGDPRLRVITQANAGPGPARNRGIAEARHAWIAFLDADDVWAADHLAELDRVRTAFPHAGLIGTRFVNSDPRGGFVLPPAEPGRFEEIDLFDRIGRGELALYTSSAAAPAAVLREFGGFRPFARGEDSELWARIALTYPVARSTRATAVYVKGTQGITERLPNAWGAGPPRALSDLSPAVALVLAELPTVSLDRRQSIERYIERYLDWTLRRAVAVGDCATVRALAPLYRQPPPALHRAVFGASALPQPLGLALARVALRAAALLGRLRVAFSSATGRGRGAPRPSRPPA